MAKIEPVENVDSYPTKSTFSTTKPTSISENTVNQLVTENADSVENVDLPTTNVDLPTTKFTAQPFLLQLLFLLPTAKYLKF